MAVKCIIDIEGRITTGGSMIWAYRVASETATLVPEKERAVVGLPPLPEKHSVITKFVEIWT